MKQTLTALAKSYGIDFHTLKDYKDDGVNIYDAQAVELHRISLNPPDSMKEYSIDDMGDVGTIKEDFIAMKFKKLTYETNLKESESILKDIDVQKRKGELVPINEVCEVNLLVSSKVKAQLKALSLTLPPKLEGLTIKEMSKVIDESLREVLEYLCSELNMIDE